MTASHEPVPPCGFTHEQHLAAWRSWRDDCQACGFAMRDPEQCASGHSDDGVQTCGACGFERDQAAPQPTADRDFPGVWTAVAFNALSRSLDGHFVPLSTRLAMTRAVLIALDARGALRDGPRRAACCVGYGKQIATVLRSVDTDGAVNLVALELEQVGEHITNGELVARIVRSLADRIEMLPHTMHNRRHPRGDQRC